MLIISLMKNNFYISNFIVSSFSVNNNQFLIQKLFLILFGTI